MPTLSGITADFNPVTISVACPSTVKELFVPSLALIVTSAQYSSGEVAELGLKTGPILAPAFEAQKLTVTESLLGAVTVAQS